MNEERKNNIYQIKEEILKILSNSDFPMRSKEIYYHFNEAKPEYYKCAITDLERTNMKTFSEIREEYELSRRPFCFNKNTRLFYSNEKQIENWIRANNLS